MCIFWGKMEWVIYISIASSNPLMLSDLLTDTSCESCENLQEVSLLLCKIGSLFWLPITINPFKIFFFLLQTLWSFIFFLNDAPPGSECTFSPLMILNFFSLVTWRKNSDLNVFFTSGQASRARGWSSFFANGATFPPVAATATHKGSNETLINGMRRCHTAGPLCSSVFVRTTESLGGGVIDSREGGGGMCVLGVEVGGLYGVQHPPITR